MGKVLSWGRHSLQVVLTSVREKDIYDTREPMSYGQVEGRTTPEVRGRVKLDAGFNELPGFAPEGRGGGGRAEIREGGRVGGVGRDDGGWGLVLLTLQST